MIRAAGAGPGDHSYRAMEILLHGHVRDPGMGQICGRIFYFVHAPVAEALIRSVLKEHPNRSDRARACHALASYLMYQAKMIRRIREKPATIDEYVHERHKAATARFVKEADPNALDRQAEALLERVVAEFADVPDWYDKRPLGAIAEGELFAVRHLSVGKLAPEVVGRDHEGKLFALAEYRGKVVVLTFSGNWCGPCAGMYPQERELAAPACGQALHPAEREHGRQPGYASGVDRQGRDHLAMLVGWRHDRPHHHAVGRSLIPVDLCAGPDGRDPFQGCTGRRARPGGHVIAGRGGGQEPCALIPGIRGGASWKLATRLLSPGGPDRLGRPSMPAQVRASSTWRHRSFPDLPEGPRLDLGPLLLARV